ncbi:ATP-dependent helicase [Chitinophaga varians]|uniref:DNA 3'-5' helicase n=1 Tax=Chitinophaga varians TaxID=2202339 RepID=A0A847RSB5_9BACT|nr:ATP-dependent DNA helicase [Chitinophaga varians]NLR68540.1 ATP-dependent helicase [Chitinophaga varians]
MSRLAEFIGQTKANEQQKKAITCTEGPLLIIAGPGSGKTFTLVERIVYLVLQGVAAERIFVATFTEKAARELVSRVSNRLREIDMKVNLNAMYIGTLHSLFLRILEENRLETRLKRNYRLLDTFDQQYFIFRNIKSYLQVQDADRLLGSPAASNWDKAQKLISYLSKVSEECLQPSNLKAATETEIRLIGDFYDIYKKQLIEENALDFSTIQTEILDLLQTRPKVLEKLQGAFDYFMIDEYQDTNTIQEKILLLLANRSKNICVVGDDDQSLYRFRGASVRNILEFSNHFPEGNCQRVTLNINYRSTPDIVRFCNNWMMECDWTDGIRTFRFEKSIKAYRQDSSDQPSVIKVSDSGTQEEYFTTIYQFIDALRQSGKLTDLNQIAFLFKSVKNENVVELANFLESKDIPVFSPRSSLFFEREETQLLLGAIIFLFPNLFDDLKWKEEARLSIWDTYLAYKVRFAAKLRSDPDRHNALLQYCRKRAKEHLTLSSNTNYSFSSLLYQLLEFPMFGDYLNTSITKKNNTRAAYNIAMLSKLFYKFEYLYNINVLGPKNLPKVLQQLFNQFLRFVIEGGIEEYEDFDEATPSGCISFMTIHQSKGLEFPITVVGSLNLVPRKQFDQIDIILQNEYYDKPPFEPMEKVKNFDFYRLFYTAFSRAQNLLILTAREQGGQGRNPSKYFETLYRSTPADFNINQLHLNQVTATNVKHEYSFTSHILLYENCPLQYRFYKELEFVEVRTGGVLGGSLLHQTIEDIHKAVLRGEENQLTDDRISDWFNSNYFLLSRQQRSYMHQGQLDALLRQIIRYRDRNTGLWDRIKEAEVDVSLVKDNYILRGTIDLIRGEDDTVELIDFKSGDKPDVNSSDTKDRQLMARYQRQLEVYAHLVEERTGQKVSKMHLYFPKEDEGSPYISFLYNPERITNTIRAFDEVVNKIENKNFDMDTVVKSEKQCGNCDMRYHCNPKQYD